MLSILSQLPPEVLLQGRWLRVPTFNSFSVASPGGSCRRGSASSYSFNSFSVASVRQVVEALLLALLRAFNSFSVASSKPN